jgi:hypothetical protein
MKEKDEMPSEVKSGVGDRTVSWPMCHRINGQEKSAAS